MAKRIMCVAWPAFLVAGLLEMLVFAVVDPHDLHWLGNPIEVPRQAVYTLAFFLFWMLTMISGSLTVLLAMSSDAVNEQQTSDQ